MNMSGKQRQHGVALVEALVGMLIFAFGVLGLVGLQASMTRAQTTAKIRADAAYLANDLFALVQTDHITRLSLYSDASCAGYVRCADWKRKVEATLPSAEIVLVGDAGTGTVNVTLTWIQGDQDRNRYNSSMVWQQ
ncbi:MAG: pilus assembly protein PilV [Burkholderiaceae bacterium]|nr:pilus assembly protein PilV [Burkholderiaceae bacterium]